MKKIEIPEQDATLLRQWLAEDGEPIDRVLDALEKVEPALKWKTLAANLAKQSQVDQDKIEPLLRVILSAINTIAHFDEEDRKEAPQILFHSIVGGVADSAKRDTFLQRFARVAQAKSIEITGKALSILQEDQREFCTARIVSQLRPVFSDEPLEPLASVVIHQLKLVYHVGPGNSRSEFYIALTMSDLKFLKEIIDRSLAKHQKLVLAAQKANIPVLEGSTHE